MIALSGLVVEAGAFHVGPLDLEVAHGEYGVLLGPSGAGKSLVLEALAGVRRLAAGAIAIDGADVTALAPEKRRVGLVFQDGLLFPHLSVGGNVAYGLRRAGVCGTSRPRRRGGAPGGGRRDRRSAVAVAPTRSRGASVSGWPWRGRSRRARAPCSLTSLSAPSMRRRARGCRRCFAA